MLLLAEGHELTSRLSKAIQRETDATKKLLAEFNAASTPQLAVQRDDPPATVEWSDITDVTSAFWTGHSPGPDFVPVAVRRRAIELVLSRKHAKEEVAMLRADMAAFISFYCKEHQLLVSATASIGGSAYARGARAVLQCQVVEVEARLMHAARLFSGRAVLPALPALTHGHQDEIIYPGVAPDTHSDSDSDDDEEWEDVTDGEWFCYHTFGSVSA